MGKQKTRLVCLCLIVSIMFGGYIPTIRSNTLPPDVILPWLKFDRKTNSIVVTWIAPPDNSEIKGYRIYADFLGNMPAGEVDSSTTSFTHVLDRSLIGLPVTYTVKSFSDVESNGIRLKLTPSLASVELTGFGGELPIAAGTTVKIGIKRNKYATGHLLLDITVLQQSFEARFTTQVDENQNEVFYTAPTLNGKAVARVWLGEDRTCLIGEFESQVLTSKGPSFITLVEPKNNQQIVKGNTVKIVWEKSNLPKGGAVKIELWDTRTGKVFSEFTSESESNTFDWKLQSLFRPERVAVVVYYKHLVNYYATRMDSPAIVLLSKQKILVPPKPVVKLDPDQKRNLIDMNVTFENSGTADVKWLDITAKGSDSSVRNYKIAPEGVIDYGAYTARCPLYHVKIGVKYTVSVKSVTADGDSPLSDEVSFDVPRTWAQAYIENLKPGDSIVVGSRLKLLWKVSNIGTYLGADQMGIVTPEKTYSLDYFNTSARSTMLDVLLEGLVESDNAKLWIKVVTTPDPNGFSETFFEFVDGLKLVSPPKFDVTTTVGTDRVSFAWEPVDRAEYYNIRKRGFGEKFMRIKTLRQTTVFEDDELTADSDYDYQIEARGITDEVISRADIAVHSKPNDIKPTFTKSKYFISLNWQRVRWVEGYNVYRYDVSDWLPVNSDSLSLPEYIDSGLVPGKEYCYRIEAVTSSGRYVGRSDRLCITTDIGRIEAKLTPDTQTVQIGWDTDSEIFAYRVWRKDIGAYAMIADNVKGRGYLDKNLEPYKVFTYKVEGLDSNGNVTAVSDELETRTLQIINMNLDAIPNPPQSMVKLKWNKVENAARIELWRDGKLLKLVASDLTAYLDTGLALMTRYCYVIKAYNNNGNIIASGDICVDMPKSRMKVVFTVGSKSWWIDGQKQDDMTAAPQMKDGRLYLIVRYLVQVVGARVAWEASTKTVSIMRKDGYWLTLTVGDPRANVNGTMTEIEPGNPKVAPFISNGVTFCPFRFICNQLGAKNENITWDAKTKTVTIEF